MSQPVGHHPSLPPHRTADEAMRAVPVVIEVVRGAPVADIADCVQAVAVVIDFGSQHFHSGVVFAGPITTDEVVRQLEIFAAGPSQPNFAAGAFPWQVIVPIVIEAFLRWWQSRS